MTSARQEQRAQTTGRIGLRWRTSRYPLMKWLNRFLPTKHGPLIACMAITLGYGVATSGQTPPCAAAEQPGHIPAVSVAPTQGQQQRSPLVWFAPLPSAMANKARPYGGSEDFMELFRDGSPWSEVAQNIAVFQLYGGWIARRASDDELERVVKDLQRRKITLAAEVSPLEASARCGKWVEGFAGKREFQIIAERIRRAGGKLDYLALDEPFTYGSLYQGENACRWAIIDVAKYTADFVRFVHTIFPEARVGLIESLGQKIEPGLVKEWLTALHEQLGSDLAFIHLDLQFARRGWPAAVQELEAFARERQIPFGIIYIGDPCDRTDYAWLNHVRERVLAYEKDQGAKPDHVVFQSWHDKPDHVLPEAGPWTFANIVQLYLTDGLLKPLPVPEEVRRNLALSARVSASHSATRHHAAFAVDGECATYWSSGGNPPQWIELRFDRPHAVAAIQLTVSQSTGGRAVHRVMVRGPGTNHAFQLIRTFDGETRNMHVLAYEFTPPVRGIDTVRIETEVATGWVAWREIEVLPAD